MSQLWCLYPPENGFPATLSSLLACEGFYRFSAALVQYVATPILCRLSFAQFGFVFKVFAGEESVIMR